MLNHLAPHPARSVDPAISFTSFEAGLIVYYLLFWPRRGRGRQEWSDGNGTSLVSGYFKYSMRGLTFGSLIISCSVTGVQARPVPHRRWRKRSHGANTILSASRPITTMTSMTPITWSMAFNSRP